MKGLRAAWVLWTAGLLMRLMAGTSTAAGLECYLIPALEKIGPGADLPRLSAGPAMQLYAARNEYEAVQIAVVNPGDVSMPVEIRCAPLRPEAGDGEPVAIRLYREIFMTVTRPSDRYSVSGAYPDPLLPVPQETTDLTPGLNVFYLEVYVPGTAGAGGYCGNVTVKAGGSVHRFDLRLKVWDFVLPQRGTLLTAFGMDFKSILDRENLTPDAPAAPELLRRYYRLLAEHRVSPISVYPEPVCRRTDPVDVDVKASEPFWRYAYDELQFNTLRIPFDERMPVDTRVYPLFSAEYNRRVVAYLRWMAAYLEQNGWLDRAYIYISTVDEPVTPGDYAKSRRFYALVKEADPRLKYRHGEQIDFNLQNRDACDILDFNLLAFQRHQRRAAALRDKQLGWYPAVGPKGKYPAYFIDRPALEPRILCWLNYFFDIPRLIYWNTTWWRQVRDPYQDPMTYSPRPDLFANGDGSLLYPAAPRRLAGPAASLRLKMIRDGLEDYEYLVQLERYQSRERVLRLLETEMTDLTHFPRRPEILNRLRVQIGENIEWEAKQNAGIRSNPKH